MAKLFRGKVQPFGASRLRFTQSALLAAVAIVGLKSLVEFIRLQTLGKAGAAACMRVCRVQWRGRHLVQNQQRHAVCSALYE